MLDGRKVESSANLLVHPGYSLTTCWRKCAPFLFAGQRWNQNYTVDPVCENGNAEANSGHPAPAAKVNATFGQQAPAMNFPLN